ncbi:DinB family protein [Ectobacillus sp. sgz5001026]|uniref:DinB family protein n=1 Tax=Ectobacillus sp. sgz5001026 TaxID=3242473 RepID=UPI0036D24D77
MSHYIFKQLQFVRKNTIRSVENLYEEASLYIPQGFNNNIKWNLGHIYVVQERFAFHFTGEKMNMPDHFMKQFGPGSKPTDWDEQVPTLRQLIALLQDQIVRIEQVLEPRITEAVKEPYTTSSGITLSSVAEFLSFSMYHEGMHFDAIKSIKRLIEHDAL